MRWDETNWQGPWFCMDRVSSCNIQGDSFGTRPKKMRISQRLSIRFWTCIYDYIPCFMRSMSILVCRSLTSWHHQDNDWRLAPCRAQPCNCVVLSENLQRICGSTWWWRAPKRLFSAGWSHIPHLEWEHDRNRKLFDDRIISKALWPPRSPDLSPPDYSCGAP